MIFYQIPGTKHSNVNQDLKEYNSWKINYDWIFLEIRFGCLEVMVTLSAPPRYRINLDLNSIKDMVMRKSESHITALY